MNASNSTQPILEPDDEQESVLPKRNLWKTLLILLGLILTLSLGYSVFRTWQARLQLEARLAKLRDQGVPLTLDKLYSKSLPEDDNAQTWFRRSRPYTEKLAQLLNDYQSTEEYRSLRPNTEQVKMLQQAFAQHAEAFSLYTQAAACSGYQSDWRIGTLPSESLKLIFMNSSETRLIMRHCLARAGLLMAQDKFEEALKLGLQMLTLSRRVEYQPMVLGYLVSMACRLMSLNVIGEVLQRSALTDEQRQRIDSALADCESVNGYKHAMASERIYGLASFRSDIFVGSIQSFVIWKFKLDACDYLDLMDDMASLATQPRHAISEKLIGLTQREVGSLTRLVTPALLRFRNSHDRSLARVRCVRLLNALQRKWPEGIPDKPIFNELPGAEDWRQDPFTGKPLIIRVTEKAVVAYSVGINGTDDGGSLDDHEDQGIRIEYK